MWILFAGDKLKHLLYHVILLFVGQRRIHWQTQAMRVIVLHNWQRTILPSVAPVVWHQMERRVMHLGKHTLCAQKVIQTFPVGHLNDIKMESVTDVAGTVWRLYAGHTAERLVITVGDAQRARYALDVARELRYAERGLYVG